MLVELSLCGYHLSIERIILTLKNKLGVNIMDATSATGIATGYGAGQSDELTAALEAASAEANEHAMTQLLQQTEDGIESGKQQTLAKQMSNAFKNANLINY